MVQEREKNVLLLSLSTYPYIDQMDELRTMIDKQHRLEEDYMKNPESDRLDWGNEKYPQQGEKMHFFKDQYSEETANIFTFQTNEPGTKAVLNQCEGKLDLMILLASKTVLRGGKNLEDDQHKHTKYGPNLKKRQVTGTNPEGHFMELDFSCEAKQAIVQTAFDFYVDQIKHYIACFHEGIYPKAYVLEMEDDTTDLDVNNYCSWVAGLLIKLWDEQPSKLYLETNGGPRDAMAILIGTLRAIANHNIEPVCAMYSYLTDKSGSFHDKPNKILDKKNIYNFFDLVSGLDDFLSVGRSERLIRYFSKMGKALPETLKKVQNLSRAFSLCIPNYMIKSVFELTEELKKEKQRMESGEHEDELYCYVIKEIERDFGAGLLHVAGDLQNGDELLIPIMEWALKKDYLQQTITLFAEKVPHVLVKKKILYYATENAPQNKLSLIADLEKGKKEYPVEYSFIQQYLCSLSTKYSYKNLFFKNKNDSIAEKIKAIKQDGSEALEEEIKEMWVQGYLKYYDQKAYDNGTFIERIFGIEEIPNYQKIYTKLQHWEVAELMREYYSVKELRNNVNHADKGNSKKAKAGDDKSYFGYFRDQNFCKYFSDYDNYEELKLYLQACINNLECAVKIASGADRRDWEIRPAAAVMDGEKGAKR